MNQRRVVITGIGLITPIGHTIEEVWNNLINGYSSADYISKFDALVMFLNWLLFLTLLMGLHFRSITSVYAVILAYVVLLFGYFSSLRAEKLLKNWVKN